MKYETFQIRKHTIIIPNLYCVPEINPGNWKCQRYGHPHNYQYVKFSFYHIMFPLDISIVFMSGGYLIKLTNKVYDDARRQPQRCPPQYMVKLESMIQRNFIWTLTFRVGLLYLNYMPYTCNYIS